MVLTACYPVFCPDTPLAVKGTLKALKGQFTSCENLYFFYLNCDDTNTIYLFLHFQEASTKMLNKEKYPYPASQISGGAGNCRKVVFAT